MSNPQDNDMRPMPEQITYANLLFYGAWAGIFLLVVTYALYLSGAISPHVDIAVVPQHWGKGVNEYLHITKSPQGWSWINLLGKGDFLNFIGLVLLAVMTIICYVVLLPGYLRRKDRVYAIICVLEVVVLAVAASGILGSGGH